MTDTYYNKGRCRERVVVKDWRPVDKGTGPWEYDVVTADRCCKRRATHGEYCWQHARRQP